MKHLTLLILQKPSAHLDLSTTDKTLCNIICGDNFLLQVATD